MAMAQLTEQRGALISALHVRAARMLNSGGDQGGGEAGLVPEGDHQESAAGPCVLVCKASGDDSKGLGTCHGAVDAINACSVPCILALSVTTVVLGADPSRHTGCGTSARASYAGLDCNGATTTGTVDRGTR